MGDGYFWVLIAILFALVAQFKVQGTFNKFSKTKNIKGYTGAQVAMQLLHLSGIRDVTVERVSGKLTDHYDPKARILRLSDTVYNSTSLAAIGVAAHETGHAVQHATGYAPLNFRSAMFPLVSISSRMAMPLIFIGFLLSYLSSSLGQLGIYVVFFGIALFAVVVLFQVVTLPVEFNASNRAIEMLDENGILTFDELIPAKKVLNAAAMTYIAALGVSVAQLLRFILLAMGSSRR